MTTKVTKESLAENIGRLESYGDLSINEEYQLKAYRMLFDLVPECEHDYAPNELLLPQCIMCGRLK